jgi:hypothetical protein
LDKKLSNVHENIRDAVSRDRLACELAEALRGMFTITSHRRVRRFEAMYTVMYCKPSKSIAATLLFDRELLALIANFDDIEVRTVELIKEFISSSNGRLQPATGIVVHADRRGNDKLRTWGLENGISIIPIYRAIRGAIPSTEILKQNIARELFASDPFQVTGPVINDIDFFGRGTHANELLRQLQIGRIRSLFGIRKVGKTSLINKVINLARDAGTPRIAMVDCSIDDFNKLNASGALKALAKVAKMAATRGYAHITDALKRTDQELVPVFDDLWNTPSPPSLVIIFDEVDYITPDSPTAYHWRTEFNSFWREFRVLVQEAQRHEMTISLLVSGVSSRSFRQEQIDGIENSALHLVPEDYLSPFARGASESMLRDLERRCGLQFAPDARALLAEACGDFPFWMRMAGSHVHRALDIDSRPINVSKEMLQPLLNEFVTSEGADISKVAIENMHRVYPEIVDQLSECLEKGRLPLGKGRLLTRYGLAFQVGMYVEVNSAMVRAGLELRNHDLIANRDRDRGPVSKAEGSTLHLGQSEWAEELAVINRRRNQLERKMRDFVRFALKLTGQKGENWVEKVLRALPEKRRNELASLSGDAMMEKLFWLELESIVSKHWPVFEQSIGDKSRFQESMKLLNDRPDAHAKAMDFADVALQRKHLGWLEEKITS